LYISSQGGVDGISAIADDYLTVDHCVITNFWDCGIKLAPSTSLAAAVSDTVVQYCGYGIYADNANQLLLAIHRCRIEYGLNAGIWIGRARGVSIHDTTVNLAGYGIRVAGSAAALYATQLAIEGGVVSNANYGLYVVDASSVSVHNMTVTSCSTGGGDENHWTHLYRELLHLQQRHGSASRSW